MITMSDKYCQNFLDMLVEDNICSYQDILQAILSQLNPPQVGTNTTKIVKKNYPKRKAWSNVKKWFYAQTGKCEDCGTRLDLQTDHILPKELGGEDEIKNFALRCRRCNVAKRPSHKNAGKLPMTTSAMLMWILLTYRPRSYEDYETLCRKYKMTMASIRFQEAWALAEWLITENKYHKE